MTYDEWIIAVATEAPKLSGSALKLLLHLAAVSIRTGSTQVRASDRELETQLDICRPALTDAKKSLVGMISIESRPGVPSTFNLPADWFPGQRTLFTAPVARFPSQQWQEKLATTGQESLPPLANFTGRSGQQSWPGGQESEPLLARKTGQVANLSGHTGQESEPPATQNQQDGGAPSNRIESNRSSLDSPKIEILDRVLDTVEIPAGREQEAETMRRELHRFAQQRGRGYASINPPKDELVAKCLAIAGSEKLCMTLASLASNPAAEPRSYFWFVVTFLDQLSGIPSKMVAARMQERKTRKAPERETLFPAPAEMVNTLNSAVRRIR